MAFTDQEQARIRHFLSYPSWSQLASSIQLGVPSGSQPLFLLEQSFKRLLPGGEEAVRIDLCECEDIEKRLRGARDRFEATAIGNLKLNPQEVGQLRGELNFWSTRLADDLGVVKDPYSQAAYSGLGSGINSPVTG